MENEVLIKLRECVESKHDFGKKIQNFVKDKNFNKYFHGLSSNKSNKNIKNQTLLQYFKNLLKNEARIIIMLQIFNSLLDQKI